MQQFKTLQVGSYCLYYPRNAQDHAKIYSLDIITGTYEGGFTLWQCTIDLMNYIKDIDFRGKTVLEIGCGHGLVGIIALLQGADKVCFADFNKDVLEKLTIKNIQKNVNKDALNKCSFLYGDWMSMQTLGQFSVPPQRFDIILGSELIYECSNYPKISYVIQKYLKEGGEAILANKVYYFGVGGSVAEFSQFVQGKGLKIQSLRKIVPESGNKKQIISVHK